MTGKKYLITTLLIITLLASLFLFAACSGNHKKDKDIDLSGKVSEKLDAYRTDLQDSSKAMKSNEGIRKYLTGWADSKDVDYCTDKFGNVIMTVDSSKDYKEANPTVIVCPYDYRQFSSYINPVAAALYIVKNNEKTGALTVVFTQETGHDYYGVRNLNNKYFTDVTKVFCFNGNSRAQFSLNSGAGTLFRFNQTIRTNPPQYRTAYRITLKGLQSCQINSDTEDHINPITTFRELLADMKSESIDYELSVINGGSNDSLQADSATMTLVINENDLIKFTDFMKKRIKSFEKVKSGSQATVQYNYKKTGLPSKVIRMSDMNRFVNFMYTLPNGEYSKNDNGKVLSVNGICYVHTNKKSIDINSVAYSLDKSSMTEIIKAEKTLCSLSDVRFRILEKVPMWNSGKEQTPFTKAVADAYYEYTEKNLRYNDSLTSTAAGYIKNKNRSCEIVAVSMNDVVTKNCAGTIVRYLINTKPDKDD